MVPPLGAGRRHFGRQFARRGGYRTIVGYRKGNSDRLIFLYAFSKTAKATISGKEHEALSVAAERFIAATAEQISALLAIGEVWEVASDE